MDINYNFNLEGVLFMFVAVKELLEEFESNKKLLTAEQKQIIKEDYKVDADFEYAKVHLSCILKAKKNHYKKMLHYMGLEYEEDEIGAYIEIDGYVLVSYNLSDRMLEIIDALENNN